MLGSIRGALVLSLLGGLVWPTAASALTVTIATGSETLRIEDGGEQDKAEQAGTIRFVGTVADLEVQLVASETNTSGRVHRLTLAGPTGEKGPEPLVTNGGESLETRITVESSRFEPIGPSTRTALHYQGSLTDVEDARLALAVPLNGLSASVAGAPAGEIKLPPVVSEGETVEFDNVSEPVERSGEVSGMVMTLLVKLATGDALVVDEARAETTVAAPAEFNLVPYLAIGGAAMALLLGLLLLRPRRERR